MILKCLNYNTWFSPKNYADRMRALLSIIDRYKPHIITLQELLGNSLQFFEQSLPDYYSTQRGLGQNEYGVTILSLLEPETTDIISFPNTVMDRDIHLIQLNIEDIPVRIATTHLESLEETRTDRIKQFDILMRRLDKYPNVIVMGDMNLDQVGEQRISLPKGWWDVWEKLDYSDKYRFTYDYQNNMYVKSPNRFRPDRVYYRAKYDEFEPISFRLVGRKKVNGIHPSDHFGIYTQFDISSKS